MVSLAMALALAEMTRGQAEIDSLFIDEGFGTLDQDSLEDVLDMLNQIQNRGLMVGVISHIKALTNAIPVNLVLTKKQDGTSSIGIVAN
jgi:exonuclease SbcC